MSEGFKGTPHELYQPSNGTEGAIFMGEFCDRCLNQPEDLNEGCEILGRTFFLNTKDKNYPREWRYTDEGEPTCTAFERRIE